MSFDKHISVNQLTGIVVTILALCISVYLGTLVGSQDFSLVAAVFLAFAGIAYFIFASQYWIWFALIWTLLGFLIRPIGPTLHAVHIALALCAAFLIAYAWRRHPAKRDEEALQRYFGPFKLSLAVYLCYMAFNAILTMYFPHDPLPVRWGNLAKQNVDMWGGFVLIAIALKYPLFCRIPKHLANWMLVVFISALIVNTIIRAYATIVFGYVQHSDLASPAATQIGSVIRIPVINLIDSEYILRAIAPLGALIATTFIYTRSSDVACVAPRSLSWLLLLCSIAAAFFAGGRATLLLTFLMPCTLLLFLKRYVSLLLIAGCAVLSVLIIKVLYLVWLHYQLFN